MIFRMVDFCMKIVDFLRIDVFIFEDSFAPIFAVKTLVKAINKIIS